MSLNIDRLVAMLSSLGSLFWCLILLLPNGQFKPLQNSFIEKVFSLKKHKVGATSDLIFYL